MNKPNAYVCPNGHSTVTVDIEEGVTPMLIQCPQCPGLAQSSGYRVPANYGTVAKFEWYRPDAAETATLDRATRAHVKQGGLLLRPRVKGGAA